MQNARPATIDDVAREAGVSRQTVSNVLNTPQIVKDSTRDKVAAVIDRLGYSPLASARRLRTGRSSTIAIHLDPYAGGISGVVLDRFVHALTECAGERGLRVLVHAARSAEQEMRQLSALADAGEVDGVVVTGTFHGDPRTGWLSQRGLPFVSFGRPWGADDIDDPAHHWVDVDGAAGTRAATNYLVDAVGARIAFLGWPAGSGTGDDRERGWREALPRGGSFTRLISSENVAQAREVVSAAIAEDRFDALVCASDSLAIGARLASVASQLEGLPIVGFDNTPAAQALGLSSVEQRPEDAAAAVVDVLTGGDAVIAAKSAEPGAAHRLIAPRLIVR